MNDIDLLERSLSVLYVELKAMADLCDDPSKKAYYHGRVSGLELGISLLSAWKKEVLIPEMPNEWAVSLARAEVKTSQ